MCIAGLFLGAASPAAAVVKIGDITHFQGARENKLLGMGLVIGLAGTGDGGKFTPSVRALAQLHGRFANPLAGLDELKNVKNIAIVNLEATLSENGAREGERVDVYLSAPAAKSLAGGRLLLTPLVGPHPDDPRIMALASGPLVIDDPARPNTARIVQGATLEQDWVHTYAAPGRELAAYRAGGTGSAARWILPDEFYVTLVLDKAHGEWSVAYAIAQSINEEASIPEPGQAPVQLALAFDPRTVLVRLPAPERANPAPFLARIENLALLMPYTEARVVVNYTTGDIVLSGDVEISPVIISHKGLTITTTLPEPRGTPENPRIIEQDFVGLDPEKKGGAKMADLLEALNQIRVTPQDRVQIIKKIHDAGKLHATLIVEK